MKYKYVMIGGFAFTEEEDMKKLGEYAKKGWILEGIKGGFFYKLKKEEPQDIIYSLDYQEDTSNEYFKVFNEAGWKHVLSMEGQMHIFSAKTGTKPIYSDTESEINKYVDIKKLTMRGMLCSLIIGIIIIVLLNTSLASIKPILYGLIGIGVIDFVVFIFNSMPYFAYSYRIRKMNEGEGAQSEERMNSALFIFFEAIGVILLILGVVLIFFEKRYFGFVFIGLGIFEAIFGFRHGKKNANSK